MPKSLKGTERRGGSVNMNLTLTRKHPDDGRPIDEFSFLEREIRESSSVLKY